MPTTFKNATGPVDNSHSANSVFKTLPLNVVKITHGFWNQRQSLNRTASLKHAYKMLHKAGNFHNLMMAAGLETGSFRGMNFADENIYKWLESIGWELGRAPDSELQSLADETITLITKAQASDGYLNSYYQVVEPTQRWSDMDFGHELYCAGHFFQAAIAFQRALADERLLRVAVRFADHIDSVFGPGKKEEACGHPEVEMALVELSRLTGDDRYRQLAQFFVDQRGKKKMRGIGANGPTYHQDHVPVREAQEVAGHAVRQMYLATALADLYMESGEQSILETSQRLWEDMTGSKMYITGGVGSRYDGESFGESYELPPDQCYCETCAAIGNFYWNWRMLLITGDSRYADLMERLLYNGILSSPSLEGTGFFYVNPLMLRNGRYVRLSTNPDQVNDASGRPEWHSVSCCPPNFMRLVASLSHYFVTHNATGIQIHHYGNMDVTVDPNDQASMKLNVKTNYPWDGRVWITVENGGHPDWTLSLRIPGWCQSASVQVNGQDVSVDSEGGYVQLQRPWVSGDVVNIEFDMPPFWVRADPRVDSVRGCVALQRGPIVYCLEAADQESDVNLLDVRIDLSGPVTSHWHGDLLGGVVTLEAVGYQEDRSHGRANGLYRLASMGGNGQHPGYRVKLTAIPYYAWGNRGLESMRVWIPYNTLPME